jgi:rare lipoprotein A (peptidoglycan hydrolase)
MRPSFTAALATAALLGLSSLPAAAAVDREATGGWRIENGTIRHQFARAAIDDGRVRARGAYERWERPRRARSTHARTGKRARRHLQSNARGHALRQRRAAWRPARQATRTRAVRAVPAGPGLVGVASYYGGRFHGRRTASGVRFDMNGLTAAHRTLPFGTRVRVTHLGNGRTVDVRINDRGPYIGGRIIDLSRGAAGAIGMHHQGVARVKVTVLGR